MTNIAHIDNPALVENVTTAAYLAQPQSFFAEKVQALNTLLLESAEVFNKRGTQSLIGVNCALKIVGKGRVVQIFALNQNGLALAQFLAQANFPDSVEVNAQLQSPTHAISPFEPVLTFNFKPCSTFCDEISRLKLPNPLDVLRLVQHTVQSLEKILLTGVIAFDFINTFEHVVDEAVLEQGHNTVPDLCFYLYDVSLVIDHIQHTSSVCTYRFADDAEVEQDLACKAGELSQKIADFVRAGVTKEILATVPCKRQELLHEVEVDISDQDFSQMVRQLKEHIMAGDVFQVVPSRTFSLPCPDVDLSFAYLKHNNPSPYMFCLKDTDFTLFGASPEFALRFDAKSREVAISPIAGTRPRGRVRLPDGSLGEIDQSLDERLELELRLDHKEVAEHIMLVDLARNDLARIASTGSRHTANLLHVDKYQAVMHLVSDVKATLRDDLDGLHAYLSSMNMGTLSGAPKIKAHELIYQYEGKRRGAYGGVMARLSADGSLDSCIVIRSALVKDGTAYVQAGCGVVFDSVEQAECDETRNKAVSVLMAIAQANQQLQAQKIEQSA